MVWKVGTDSIVKWSSGGENRGLPLCRMHVTGSVMFVLRRQLKQFVVKQADIYVWDRLNGCET
jgi:hypothetical protein